MMKGTVARQISQNIRAAELPVGLSECRCLCSFQDFTIIILTENCLIFHNLRVFSNFTIHHPSNKEEFPNAFILLKAKV